MLGEGARGAAEGLEAFLEVGIISKRSKLAYLGSQRKEDVRNNPR